MAVLLLIGRRAARDFAADNPVFVRVAQHRPLRVGIERRLVVPLLTAVRARIAAGASRRAIGWFIA
jgi:hypothetical protein